MRVADEIAAYERASGRLLGLIRGDRPPAASGSDRRGRAAARLGRTRALVAALDNPQNRYPIVHVTGTSGKGSVAAMIAATLAAAGYRVGLRTSPYLQVATEKLQLGSSLIGARSLDQTSACVIAAHEKHSPGSRLGYAEAWSALTFCWFAQEQVDVAVVEVGAGGRFDATNVFDPVVSVITSVGLDHTATLGPTIEDIAWHKSGIIKPGSIVAMGDMPDGALKVIQREAEKMGAPIVPSGRPIVPLDPMTMPGAFQQTNAAVAFAAIEALRSQGFMVDDHAIANGLESARLPGRLEAMPRADGPTVWLDGAHNADKIAALAREAYHISAGGPLPVVVLGVLRSKDAGAIAAGIAPHASAIIATEPAVVGREALGASALAAQLSAAGFTGRLVAEPDAVAALRCARALARGYGSNVVATGSMYLVGQLRRAWFSDDQIVIQRTPWPLESEACGQTLPDRSVAL